MKLLSFVLSVFLVTILLWHYGQSRMTSLEYLDRQGTKYTLTLTLKDRKRLTGLMQKLFAQGYFAYTSLGSKPISWETYLNSLPVSSWMQLADSFSEYHHTIRSGWKTWKKYQHLFPDAHLVAENSKYHPGSISILLINEDQLNVVVNKNKKDFEDVLRREVKNGFQLIEESNSKPLLDEVLKSHQGLIGIVLGYGRDNSWKFMEGCKTQTPIGWVWGEESNYFTADSLEQGASQTDYYLSHYPCPSFAGDPNSEESLALKSEYILTRQKVLEYYKDKDFLEATLSLLAGYRP